MDKAKNILSKTKTAASRAEQKVMQKVGKAESTVDISYNQEKDRFLDTYKTIQKFQKDVARFLDIFRELSLAQTNLSDYLSELFDSTHAYHGLGTKGIEVVKLLDNARLELDTMMRTDILDPMKRYEIQYKEIENRLDQRTNRRVDMDRYAKDLKAAQEKNKLDKAPQLEQKYQASKANYQALHEELLHDLPLLHDDRIPFFNPIFASFFVALNQYFESAEKAVQELDPLTNSVDRNSVLNHPRITTDTAVSYAKNKISPSAVSGMDYSPYPSSSSSPVQHSRPPPPLPGAQVRARALF